MSEQSQGLRLKFEVAIALRQELLRANTICRILDGSAEQVPNIRIDKLGTCLLIHIRADSLIEAENQIRLLVTEAEWLCLALQCQVCVARIHLPSARDSAELSAHVLWGECPEVIELSEGTMRFFIKPLEAVNAGIFVDTRDIREYLRTHSFGKRVLNLFCYTGLLGLAASVGKAAEVVQVDVSKRVLAWAKENWQLNAETGAGPTRFICEDSSAFLDKEARRVARGKQGYDIVIIDPPAYGAAGKGGFSLLRDLPTLVAGIMKVLGPNGELLLMCNLRELSSARLADIVSDAASKSGRDLVSCVELMAPATDFRASSLQASSMRGVQAKLA